MKLRKWGECYLIGCGRVVGHKTNKGGEGSCIEM